MSVSHGSKGTPLHAACALNRKDRVSLLLKHGADPNEWGYNTGDGGDRPIDFTNDDEIIQMLKKHDQV